VEDRGFEFIVPGMVICFHKRGGRKNSQLRMHMRSRTTRQGYPPMCECMLVQARRRTLKWRFELEIGHANPALSSAGEENLASRAGHANLHDGQGACYGVDCNIRMICVSGPGAFKERSVEETCSHYTAKRSIPASRRRPLSNVHASV